MFPEFEWGPKDQVYISSSLLDILDGSLAGISDFQMNRVIDFICALNELTRTLASIFTPNCTFLTSPTRARVRMVIFY